MNNIAKFNELISSWRKEAGPYAQYDTILMRCAMELERLVASLVIELPFAENANTPTDATSWTTIRGALDFLEKSHNQLSTENERLRAEVAKLEELHYQEAHQHMLERAEHRETKAQLTISPSADLDSLDNLIHWAITGDLRDTTIQELTIAAGRALTTIRATQPAPVAQEFDLRPVHKALDHIIEHARDAHWIELLNLCRVMKEALATGSTTKTQKANDDAQYALAELASLCPGCDVYIEQIRAALAL